jgi:hypothetical protein
MDKYKEALDKAKIYYNSTNSSNNKEILAKIFPELEESEDDRVKKDIISMINICRKEYERDNDNDACERANKCIDWIKKQGNPMDTLQEANKKIGELVEDNYYLKKQIEQKIDSRSNFKIGDWVIFKDTDLDKISKFDDDKVIFESGEWVYVNDLTRGDFRHWTIEDAKPGDVLAAYECLVLFKEINGWNIKCYCTYHYLNIEKFFTNTLQNKTAFSPATHKERDLLFQKIKDAGYEWNSKKLELKKK